MTRMLKNFLALPITLMLLIISPSITAEASTEWKMWTPKTEVDVDKEWTIQFTDAIDLDYADINDWDLLYKNIYVVRARDNARLYVEPYISDYDTDKKTIKVALTELYDFNETYYLYIKDMKSVKGKVLKQPTKMIFTTNNPTFNIEHTVTKEGIRFDVASSETNGKTYTKVKATNVSDEPIVYGKWECDHGLVANLILKNDKGQATTERKWEGMLACPAGPTGEYPLAPGETIEVSDVFYPIHPFEKNHVLQLFFRKVHYEEYPTGGTIMDYTPIEVEVPLHVN